MKQDISLKSRALAILARREISRQALARKLQPYCDDEAQLTDLLDDLAQRHWQSDERFAEAYVHSKSHLHGSLRLKQALAQQGVDEGIIRECLPNEATQIQSAIGVLRKKYRQAPQDLKEKHKYMHFLAYRGFDMDTIQSAMKQAWLPESD